MIMALIKYFTEEHWDGKPIRTIRGERMVLWLYATMGVLTFAHVWTNYPVVEDTYQCIQDHDVLTVEKCGRDLVGSSLAAGIAGVAWPLVVATEAYQAVTE